MIFAVFDLSPLTVCMNCSFLATICKMVRSMLSDRCLSVCDVGVLWPNGWMDYDATWYGSRSRSRPPQHIPQFSARVCCGQTAGWIKMSHGTEVGLGPDDIVLDGDLSERAEQPHPAFRPKSVCGQTVAHFSNCWALVLRLYLKPWLHVKVKLC